MRVLKRLLIIVAWGIALLAIFFSMVRTSGGLLFWYEAAPETYEVFGVDVSSYQGVVDFAQLGAQKVQFAFIKATEGSSMRDGRFAANWAGAAEAGIRAGAYHFFSYDSPGDTQADNFIGVVPITDGALPPVVDVEFYGPYLETPKAADAVWPILDALLSRLEEHYGQKPILYVTERSYKLYVQGHYDDYPLWVSFPMVEPFWRPWSFWQYSHRGELNGYQGAQKYIDLNVFRGSAEALAAFGLTAQDGLE